MEKYTTTPTPSISPTLMPTPIDPAEIVAVDVDQLGDKISIDGHDQKKTVICTRFNRVMVNGNTNEITIKGACKQIMINGDANKITADAATEFVLNGSDNAIRYSRFVNGKQPVVIENLRGNVIEKTPVEADAGKNTIGK